MPSLLERPDLVGFFSYSRRDDEHSQGALSRLRAQIHNELHIQLGSNLRLWQDTNAIPGGALWEGEIKRAIAEAVFFIPIVTPSAVASKHCRLEFDAFLEREAALGRTNLIFPLLYVQVPGLEKEEQWRQDHLLEIIARRQYLDWQKFRHRSFAEAETAEKIEQFCRHIVESLRQPWVSAAERQAAEEAEAQRIADQERRDREARERRREAEAQQQAEQERRAKDEAEARRIAEQERRAEEERQHQQAGVKVVQNQDDPLPQESGTPPQKPRRSWTHIILWTALPIGAFAIALSLLVSWITPTFEGLSPKLDFKLDGLFKDGLFSCSFYRLQNNADPKKVAIMGTSFLMQPGEEAKKRGLTVTTVVPESSDFSSFVSKANSTANAILYCGSQTSAFDSFAKQRGLVRQP
jgi:hypothetical protein